MRTFKTTLFCTLILGVLSATQTGAFARGHEGPRAHFEHQEVPHSTINNPDARPSGPATSQTQVSRPRGPEVVTPGGVISQEVTVPEGGATGARPGSKTETSCIGDPTCPK